MNAQRRKGIVARHGATGAIVVGLALGFIFPASALHVPSSDEPITKWVQRRQSPEPTTPTAGPLVIPGTPTMPLAPGRAATPSTRTAPEFLEAPPTVSVRSYVRSEKRRFHSGEEIHFFVELSWVGAAGDILPEAPEEPTLMNLTREKPMVQVTRILPEGARQTVVVTYHYVFDPVAEGAASVEPIEIPYRLRGETEVLALTTDRFALEILPRPWPWGKIVLGVVILGGAFLAAAVLAVVMVKASASKKAAAAQPQPPSPYTLMREDIDGIQRLFNDGSVRDGYDAVERLVRKALRERIGEDLRHVTINEFTRRIEGASLAAEVSDRAASILDRCAEVKFAGYAPTVADQNQIVADCRLLLDNLEKNAVASHDEPAAEAGTA
jgi:hypothetical protein